MPEYRRSRIAGGLYFFTVVTFHRQPLFVNEISRQLLHSALQNVNTRYPFTTDAICLMPEHLHCIWTLPEGDINYSLRWGEIKKIFSKEYHKRFGYQEAVSESRAKRGEAAIWQRRFWEHTIRDEEDYRRHVEYIHYNPIKHGLVKSAKDWKWSSFHRYIEAGYYDEDWGSSHPQNVDGKGFGE